MLDFEKVPEGHTLLKIGPSGPEKSKLTYKVSFVSKIIH